MNEKRNENKDVFNIESFDIVLMLLDEEGKFVEEREKFSLSNGKYVSRLYMQAIDGVELIHLFLHIVDENDTSFDLSDREYNLCMEAYDLHAYDEIEGVLYATEREAYLPLWKVACTHLDYDKMKDVLEKILSIHKEQLERIGNELNLSLSQD